MKTLQRTSLIAVVALLAGAITAQAETKVTVTGMHICCGGCAKAIDASLSEVKGIKFEVDQDNESVTINAEDAKSAQAAIDALGKAGFSGKLDNTDVKYATVATPEGKVTRLEVTGVHNCCGACNTALKKTIATIDGVKAETCKAKESSFVVEGEFDAAALIKALHEAGFYASVKK